MPGFDLGMDALLALFAAQNPQMGPQLDAAGFKPPMGLGRGVEDLGLGGMVMGEQTPSSGDAAMPALGAPPAPPAAPTADPNDPLAKLRGQMGLAALQGVVAPKPITPIVHAGVIGGVKPPEVSAKGTSQGAPAIQALMQALLQKKDPMLVPSLGSMIRGAT